MTPVPPAPHPRDGRDRPAGEENPDVVELDLPADPAYLGVVRTACAGLGARLDLTLDEIEDLRIAVDEACTLLLPEPGSDAGTGAGTGTGQQPVPRARHLRQPDKRLRARFTVDDDTLAVHVVGPNLRLPGETSYAWAVLEALAGDVASGTADDGSWISLTHTRVRGA
ncbi:anti-sigma regulatory factor [Aquipuribacter sp. SD81]|uniref:anti-sigma regulatory factor n=1 Tax=Aquipuribacter sp. SD81 TaxID=3127703 RepID=UPI00301AF1A4